MLSQVHALLISHLKSQIPLVGKDRKKAELIKHLDEVCHHDDDVGDEDDGWQGPEEGWADQTSWWSSSSWWCWGFFGLQLIWFTEKEEAISVGVIVDHKWRQSLDVGCADQIVEWEQCWSTNCPRSTWSYKMSIISLQLTSQMLTSCAKSLKSTNLFLSKSEYIVKFNITCCRFDFSKFSAFNKSLIAKVDQMISEVCRICFGFSNVN